MKMSFLSHLVVTVSSLGLLACTTQVESLGDNQSQGADAGDKADFSGPDAGAPADAQAPFDGPCGEGDASFETGDGVCFEYFFEIASWTDARSECALLGGDLASPGDLATNGILASLVPSAFPNAWLLGTDTSSEGTWSWAGLPMSFTNFRAGEPSNGGGGAAQENCLVIEANTGGKWDDRTCLELNSYICQR